MLNKEVIKIQDQAYKRWTETNKNGILNICTGLGKTFIALRAISELPKGFSVLYLAETLRREATLEEEITKYNHYYGTNLLRDYKIEFACYQSACNWENRSFDLVIADEIHDSASPKYIQFYRKNKYKQLMGLSATINNNSKYIINGREYTKLQLIESIAPVVFRFTLNQALKLNIARKATIYVYAHSLDDKTQRVFNPKYPNYKKTEKEQYEYYNQAIMSIVENSKDNMGMYRPLNQADKFKLNNLRRQRAQFLYSLPSKKSAILDILSKVKGQSIVFANSLELIEKIIPNTVSINNTKEVNTRTIKAFNDKVINTIGSFKMLQQGENFEHLDNCIIASYYSSEGPSIQRIGRLRRASTEGKIIFIVTKNTQEVQWLQKILNSFGSYQISSIK